MKTYLIWHNPTLQRELSFLVFNQGSFEEVRRYSDVLVLPDHLELRIYLLF